MPTFSAIDPLPKSTEPPPSAGAGNSAIRLAPSSWAESHASTECTLHQLAPYIGKLKSGIAADLVCEFSNEGDLVVDPFCGSGTVPLSARLNGRQAFASDASRYALVLTKGKLSAPKTLATARRALEQAKAAVGSEPSPDLRRVPPWVRAFFHPDTLRDTIRWANVLRARRDFFSLSCLLGILHHQRPGFLSFPSSHLVPYLRTRKFPRDEFPEMYSAREVYSRLAAKVDRAYRRVEFPSVGLKATVRNSFIGRSNWPEHVDSIITSPPYMNALDYARDNRLRLWFLGQDGQKSTDTSLSSMQGFLRASTSLAKRAQVHLSSGGHCVIVVGEKTTRKGERYPSTLIREIFERYAPSLQLTDLIRDRIPDIRRARRDQRGVRDENVLVFRRNS